MGPAHDLDYIRSLPDCGSHRPARRSSGLALVVPPVMAAAMVPVMFLLGRKIADWKTGILAALFIAVIAGQYFFRSFYGYLDHHIAEVLFSTIFSLVYLATLAYVRQHPVDLKKMDTLKIPVLLSLAAGFTFILGFFTMPTMILFALIVVIFTVLQFIMDFYHKRGSDDLLVVNLVLFAFATVAFFIIGPKVARPRFLDIYYRTTPCLYTPDDRHR